MNSVWTKSPQKTSVFRIFLVALVLVSLWVSAYSQDKPPAPEQPSDARQKKQELATEAQEEARAHLLRRIEARRLIRDLTDEEKKAAAVASLEKLGVEAVFELLVSKKEEARGALEELCRGWVAELPHEKYKKRERAFRLLYAAGDVSVKFLETAAKSQDPHLSHKAKLLLRMIDRRISPVLYARLGHVMAGFEKADWRKKLDMISELERLGGALAVPSLKRIIMREKNPRVQAQAANSLIRVGTLKDLLFLKKIGLAEKIQEPAITAEIYLSQGLRYMQAKRYDEAIEEFKRALKDSPQDFRAHYHIAMAYLMATKYALSVRHFQTCLAQQPNHQLAHYNIACAYSLMKDADNAVKHLGLSIDNGYDDLAHMEKDSDLDNIRSDPRYQQLKQRLQRKSDKKSPEEK